LSSEMYLETEGRRPWRSCVSSPAPPTDLSR
jgi:hypothetical protein